MNEPADLLRELRIDRSAPPPRQGEARLWTWIAAVVATVVVASAALWWFGARGGVEVRSAPVESVTDSGGSASNSVLDATGYVTARRQATVSAKITGKVSELLIEEGQRVEKGQVLARLEPIDAEAQRKLSQSQLAAARSEVSRAQVQLALAEKTVRRQRELRSRNIVAQSQLDQAESERDGLRVAVTSATRNVQVAADSLLLSDIALDNTVVRAPFAGVIVAKAAQEGEIVSPISGGGGFTRTGIGTLVDMDSLEVQVDVNEAYIGRVQPRMPVEAVLNAYPEWKIPAEVIAIVPTADRGKATVKVRIALLEKDARIVPEMGVKVSFLEPKATAPANAAPVQTLVVPAGALVEVEGEDKVFVVVDGRARQRDVSLGRTLGENREIRDGVRAGEIVVVDPPEGLKDGARVREADAESDDAP